MSAVSTFWYDEQIKKYMYQFMTIFSDLQVKVGKTDTRDESLIPVDIHYGSKDRVVGSILAGNTQNKPIRLPVLSAYISNISIDPALRHGTGTQQRFTHLPRGGVLPDDIKTVERYMPIPYMLETELGIFTSSQDQHMQILEQILTVFDPIIQIQKSDAPHDWTKITTVELTNIRFDENYPMGTDRRMIQTYLDFRLPIYLTPPANVRSSFVNRILMRIGAIDSGTLPENIVAEFDGLGIEYQEIASAEDFDTNN